MRNKELANTVKETKTTILAAINTGIEANGNYETSAPNGSFTHDILLMIKSQHPEYHVTHTKSWGITTWHFLPNKKK